MNKKLCVTTSAIFILQIMFCFAPIHCTTAIATESLDIKTSGADNFVAYNSQYTFYLAETSGSQNRAEYLIRIDPDGKETIIAQFEYAQIEYCDDTYLYIIDHYFTNYKSEADKIWHYIYYMVRCDTGELSTVDSFPVFYSDNTTSTRQQKGYVAESPPYYGFHETDTYSTGEYSFSVVYNDDTKTLIYSVSPRFSTID
ncbi:hypothetical protein AGMMS49992_29590 [Clostridia bacterium]|nr:hypothetical protein AGMMS49992_29590 [Clostridia bacterium]